MHLYLILSSQRGDTLHAAQSRCLKNCLETMKNNVHDQELQIDDEFLN